MISFLNASNITITYKERSLNTTFQLLSDKGSSLMPLNMIKSFFLDNTIWHEINAIINIYICTL